MNVVSSRRTSCASTVMATPPRSPPRCGRAGSVASRARCATGGARGTGPVLRAGDGDRVLPARRAQLLGGGPLARHRHLLAVAAAPRLVAVGAELLHRH